MRGLAFNIRLLLNKINRVSSWAFVLILLLLLLGGSFLFWPKISKIDWRFLLAKLSLEKPVEEMIEKKEEFPVLEIKIPGQEKKYTETAEAGEGITHLTRKALKKYLEENPQDFEVTAEHKIYIEDYIKDKTGERWLVVGETLTFSEELIVEAIQKSQELTPDQLENLKQYSALVADF